MESPRSARPGRVRLVASLLAAAAVLAGALVLVPGPPLRADEELEEKREELRETRDRIRDRRKDMRTFQRRLNKLATAIAENEAQIHHATQALGKLDARIDALEAETARLQAQLDERNRAAYMFGPGSEIVYLLTATSAADAASRVTFLTEMNRRDLVLAARVGNNRERLSTGRAQQLRLQRTRQMSIQQLAIDRAKLRDRLAEARRRYDELHEREEVILLEISRIHPFALCPVQGPVAIADNFGIWVKRSEERGGDHVHQGNDIMAAGGTPIVAPFDGVAVTANNKMGGLAVKVFGTYGYVYNAHLSRFGQLGPVERGDVIGYVGATGNTSANHDHFEWHPNNGPAADPYPFLTQVCY